MEKVLATFNKSNSKLHVIDLPEGCTVNRIQTEVNRIIKRRKVSLICIDYMNIIHGGDSKSSSVNVDWNMQLKIAAELKLKVARKFNVPTWTVGQVNEEKSTIAFSTHMRDQLDVGLVLKPDENTEATGVLFVDWIKTRDFKGVTFPVKTRLDIMRFYDNGQYPVKSKSVVKPKGNIIV